MKALPADKTQIAELAAFLTNAFEKIGIETAALDARLLLQAVCGVDHAGFISSQTHSLTAAQLSNLALLYSRRLNREPVSRILGETEFWSLPFTLSPDTLDPRPDTETLIELTIDMIGVRKSEPLRLLDLGTGSGCILLSLLHELPNSVGVGADINPGALNLARENAFNLGLAERSSFQVSDWFSTIEGKFDVVLSNPPYIPQADIQYLMPEVQNFDPHLALNGGESGLLPYEIIFNQVKDFLAPSGLLLLEFGIGQEIQLIEMLKTSPLSSQKYTYELRADLAGIIRTMGIKLAF